MEPFKSQDSAHYGRLFAPSPSPNGIGEWVRKCYALAKLADEMQDDGSRPPGPDIGIEAGYTYFGQFIDHDLTNDQTSLADLVSLDDLAPIRFEPEQILNRQTPHLDLSHLYGKGPEDKSSQDLYEPGSAKLRVGEPVRSRVRRTPPTDRSIDLALGADSRPLVADRRASENIILRQITSAFARLHNAAVEQLRSQATGVTDLFRKASRQTTWQFQWLVVNDYLPTILHPDVYNRVFVRSQPLFEWKSPHVFCIPIEFSVAGMRFGHSMVRNGYTLSDETDADLEALLKVGLETGPLDPKFEVDWARFFQGAGPGALATTAQPIDTLISKGMFRIPMGTLKLFNSAAVPFTAAIAGLDPIIHLRLPLITLLRGAAMRLPSGQAVADGLGVSKLSREQLILDREGKISPQGQILLDHGLTSSTPLWYYLLKEAEVLENGNHLGLTASNIIADTIFAALRDDPESYVHQSSAIQMPPVWKWNNESRQFLSLSSLFEAAPDFP